MAASYTGIKLTIAALSVAATVFAWSYFESTAAPDQADAGPDAGQVDQPAARQRTSRGS